MLLPHGMLSGWGRDALPPNNKMNAGEIRPSYALVQIDSSFLLFPFSPLLHTLSLLHTRHRLTFDLWEKCKLTVVGQTLGPRLQSTLTHSLPLSPPCASQPLAICRDHQPGDRGRKPLNNLPAMSVSPRVPPRPPSDVTHSVGS